MLILTRREDEKVILTHQGVTIEVIPVRIGGERVRLAFHAPKEVVIMREELLTRKDREIHAKDH